MSLSFDQLQGDYSSLAIARWFLNNTDEEAGEIMTHLKLQKMLYYVQSWGTVLFERKIMNTEFEAWAHGPVDRSVYDYYSQFPWYQLPVESIDEEFDPDTEHLLNEVNNIYGKFDAKHLERLTHQEAPWIQTRGSLAPEQRCSEIIPLNHMYSFYKSMQEQNN